ncbi:MAG: ABC transporter permease subunit [Aggregatilineales bacterium]
MTEIQLEDIPTPPYDPNAFMTPRERGLRRIGRILLVGAIAHSVLVILLIVLSGIAASSVNTDLLNTLADLTMARFTDVVTNSAKDMALLAGVLTLILNMSALLVAMIGILAQEVWGVVLTGAIILVNAIALVFLGFFPALVAIIFAGYAMYHLLQDFQAYRTNPVMLKELRERMRGARAFVVISIYLGLMSGFALLLYLIQRSVVQNQGTSATGELGRTLFAGVVGVELLLIIFIAPAFTSGAVTGERERKTYDLLQITLLPRSSFIIGKLESALSYIFLLLMAAIPLQSIAFLFGGVSETELVLAFIILAVTAITLGVLGLFFSTIVDRTLTASVRSYTVAFIILLGIPIVLSPVINIFTNAVNGTGSNLTNSPVIEAMLIYTGGILVSLNPIATAITTQQLLVEQQTLDFWSATLRSNGNTIPVVSPWISFTVIYLTISAALVVLAVRRMRRAEE